MAKEKDPAFLLYSKDWLQGTAGLMPDEKGVYIDLLAHQHQDGDLPNDPKRLARMVGLSQSEFDAIWANLKCKFTENNNRLVNRKLAKITTERSTKAHTKAILSRFAVLVRSAKYPVEILEKIKADFKVVDFEPFEINEATERLSNWFSERLTTALGNGNGNAFKEGEIGNGGVGEGKGEREDDFMPVGIAPDMVAEFSKSFPDYPVERDLDFSACLQIAYKIAKTKGWKKDAVVRELAPNILSIWIKMVAFIRSDKWFSTRSLSEINKQYQGLIQSMKSNATDQQPVRKNVGKSAGAYQLLDELNKNLGQG